MVRLQVVTLMLVPTTTDTARRASMKRQLQPDVWPKRCLKGGWGRRRRAREGVGCLAVVEVQEVVAAEMMMIMKMV